ncbi:MAG TPA: FAD:protein FMN transferase [Nannocystaceae bacterium]|nr:FAD:protein FMN transferase [Nannocystaceae bacterium]
MRSSALVSALALALAIACNGDRDTEGSAPAASRPAPATPPAKPVADAKAPPVRKDGTVFGDGVLMGTSISINVWLDPGRDPADAGAAMNAAFDEIARIEAIMSEWQSTSELSRLNAAAGGEPIPLSPELFFVLKRSKEISEITGGAFDVTFYGVGQLWTFERGAKPPSAAAIAEKVALVNWRGIELDDAEGTPRGRLARPGMKVGLGAIAKGYAVDRASAVLREHGFTNHVVEGGGDTYVSGTKGGKPWMVGVQNPVREGPGPHVIGGLPSSNRAVVTSGDYERYFEYEGRRYAHIFDPRTGYPLEESKSALSVTLVGANATDADAYCTAVAVMGPERGMAFVEERPELEAIIITRTGDVLISTGLQHEFVRAPPK